MKVFLFAVVFSFLYSSVSASYNHVTDIGGYFSYFNNTDSYIEVAIPWYHTTDMQLYVYSNGTYNYIDINSASLVCPTYAGYGAWEQGGITYFECDKFPWPNPYFSGVTIADIYYLDNSTLSCTSPAPAGGHFGTLTYNPTATNQSWTYGASSCGYVCTGGYTGSGCGTPPSTIPRDGLIGEWLLNGNANDTSGNGNNGTAYNLSYGTDMLGHANSAGILNGNSYITLSQNQLSALTNFTISSWVYITGYQPGLWGDGYSCIIVNEPYSDHHTGIWIRYNNSYNDILFTHSAGGGIFLTANNVLSAWQWQLITGTYNKTTGVANLYLNSDLIGTQTIAGLSFDTTNGLFTIWKKWYLNQNYFSGSLSRNRIYNRALSASEIQSLYNEWTVSNNTQTSTPLFLNNPLFSNPLAQYDFRDTTSQMCISNTKQQSNQAISKKEEGNKWDPVTLSKGEFTYDNTLMSIPGKKMPYEFKLSYKNQVYYNGPAGINWDHNYNQYLTGEINGSVLYYNGRLGVFRFTQSGGVFDYNPGLRANLSLSGSVYTMTYDNGDKYVFDSVPVDASGATANKLSRIEDGNGNNLNFAYSGGLLSTVTDTLGRNIVYSYYDHNRLRDVTDFNGHKVSLAYFTGSTASGSLYDLQSATINNGTGSVKTIGFEYTIGGDDTANHNITRLIDAKGQTYVTNAYDSGDRVSSQVYGSGTIGYAYTLSGSSITKNTVTDKLGNKTEYTYDANGNHTQIKYFNPAQTSSVVYNYEYDSAGYMTRETKPRGNGFTYSYDASGNMTEKRMKADTSAANSSNDLVTAYTYNSRGQILTETRPNGVVVTNTYDSAGNILSKTTSGIASYSGSTSSSVSTYSYLSGGFLDTVTDGEGNITRFQYSSGQIAKMIRGTGSITSTGSFAYDSYGNPTSSTDGEGFTKTAEYNPFNLLSTGTTSEGIVTAYEYDANNNKTREVRYLSGTNPALGTVQSRFYYDLLDHMTGSLVDTASGKTLLTTLKYDENGNVTEKKVGSGATTKYTYNEFGKVSSERIIMNPSNSSEDIVTGYTYDTNGNLVAKTDPLGNTTTYTYDLYDRVDKETNPKGTYTTLAYDKDGSINTKSVYSSGNTILSKSAYLSDGIRNVVKSTDYLDPVNSSGGVETNITYDRNQRKTSIVDPKGNTTSNTYDGLGRLSSTVDALGNTVSYGYDKRDLVVSKLVSPHPDPLPGGEGVIQTLSSYDHDGRLVSETDNLSQTKSLVYNALGHITRSTDEAGHHTDYERNYLGKTTKETKYLSGGTSIITTYAYDERGNLVSVKDPKNNETVYAYDPLDRNTSITYADGKQLVYTYDKNSNLSSQTDPNGSVVTNSYDATNLLSGRSVATGTGVLWVTSEGYGYDSLGRAVSGMDSNGNALGWNYDSLGRLTQENQSGSVVGYAYDSNGNLTSVTNPTGKTTSYAYDVLNRVTDISSSGASVASYVYTGILNTGILYGNGVNTVQTFDGLLRLSSLAHSNGSGTIMSRTYGYDSVGNITSDGQRSYTYDTIDRLLSATSLSGVTVPNSSEVFGYDVAGNRLSNTDTQGTTSYSGNILNQYLSVTSNGSASGSVVYSYDNNGNVVSNGVLSFGYDYKNRLVLVKKVSDDSVVAEYVYDVMGRRIEKRVGGEVTEYVYAGENRISEARTSSGQTLMKTYLNGLGIDNPIAYDQEEIDTMNTGSIVMNRYYFQKDHLGSVIALTDASGSVVQSYGYDVYGSPYVLSESGYIAMKDFVGNLHGNDGLFTGREYDGETGLYFYRARYYDPAVGRFVSRDPIGQVDDVNLYGYVGNSPVMGTDPEGLYVKQMVWDAYNWTASAIGSLPEAILLVDYAGWSDDDNVITQQKSAQRANTLLLAVGAYGLTKWWISVLSNPSGLEGFSMAWNTRGSTNFFGLLWGKNKWIHGNSNISPKPTELYELRDQTTGELKKIWETQRWERRYTKKFYDENNVEMIKTWDSWLKWDIRAIERQKIIDYEMRNGTKPPLNKSYH